MSGVGALLNETSEKSLVPPHGLSGRAGMRTLTDPTPSSLRNREEGVSVIINHLVCGIVS